MQFRTPSNAFFQSRPFLDAIPHPEQRPFFNQDPSLMQFRTPNNALFQSRTLLQKNTPLRHLFTPTHGGYQTDSIRSDPFDTLNAFLRHIRSQPPKSIQSKSALYQPVFTRPAATPLIVSRTSVTRSLGGLSLSRNF